MRQICRKKPLNLVLCLILPVLALYNVINHNVVDPVQRWESEQKDRLKIISDQCSLNEEKYPSHGDILKDELLMKRLIYNDEHQVIYCNIPKIASTNWKRIFTVLNGKVETTDPLQIAHEFVHRPQVTFSMTLFNLSTAERNKRLQTYKKFLFVRHPFERLLSAYNDKLRDNSSNSVENFQKVYGARILKRYRPHAPRSLVARGGDVTFPEFVRYLTDKAVHDRLAEPHWTPMSDLCKPCDVRYDYVGKYGSLLEDVDMILSANHIELPFRFPPKDNPKSATRRLLYPHLKNLTNEAFVNLYKTYKRDFDLFGYDYTDWGIEF